MGYEWVRERGVDVDEVVVPPALLLYVEQPRLPELPDEAPYRPIGKRKGVGDFPNGDSRANDD
jgi:hypothetical protein